jgi:hypothetical protein
MHVSLPTGPTRPDPNVGRTTTYVNSARGRAILYVAPVSATSTRTVTGWWCIIRDDMDDVMKDEAMAGEARWMPVRSPLVGRPD